MNYNSNRSFLLYPEYGRNVQEMIHSIRQEEDPRKRQAMANAIVSLMGHLAPGPKNGSDIRPKLWKHFFAIAEYQIDVVSFEGIRYETEESNIRPVPVTYPPSSETYRHYGNHVRKLIEKASQMEDGPKKSYLISLIGSYMKMAYKTWNKDHLVSDEGVLKDLKAMSKGKVHIEDETSLDVLSRRTKGGPQSLQPATSENRPVKASKFRHNRNRRFNDRHPRNNQQQRRRG